MQYAEHMPSAAKTSPFAKTLRSRREAHAEKLGRKFSLADLRDGLLLSGIPRRYVPSVATLSRMETGDTDEATVDAIVIYGMSKVYECRVSELSQEVANELDTMRDLLEHAWPCIPARRELASAR
jgi:hypothetical protein